MVLMIATFILALFGIILYRYSKKVGQSNISQEAESRAIRVSSLFEENEKLNEQLKSLTKQESELESALTNNTEANNFLTKEQNKYTIMSGVSGIKGPGVELSISHHLEITQLVDLINAIRNSGAEGVSVNGSRVIYKTPLNLFAEQEKYTIEIIGDKDVLYDALTRPGGILEQITNGVVERKDEIILPKIA